MSMAVVGTVAEVAGAVGTVVSAVDAVGNFIGGNDQPTGGSPTGGGGGSGYFDAYAPRRPMYFKGLETLMGKNEMTDEEAQAYLNRYPDLKAAFGDDLNAARQHFKEYGQGENRYGMDTATSMVLNSPTYMGGLKSGARALQTGLARTGQVGSGAEQLALQNFGQDYFNQQYQNLYNQYASISQATAAPLDMSRQNAINNAAIETNATNSGASAAGFGNTVNSVKDAFGKISGIFKGSSDASYTPNNYVDGYTSSPGYSGYSPTNQTGMMPGFGTPNVNDTSVYSPNWGGN